MRFISITWYFTKEKFLPCAQQISFGEKINFHRNRRATHPRLWALTSPLKLKFAFRNKGSHSTRYCALPR